MLGEPNIGANIIAARNDKGWTQAKLAKETGISAASLSAYENDKKTPGLQTLAKIAEALDVSIDRLYYGDESQSITSGASTTGQIVVNAVCALRKLGIASYVIIDYPSGDGEPSASMRITRCPYSIKRLVDELDDFENKQGTYPDPQAFLQQVLGSVVNEIDGIEGSSSWKR